MKKTVIVYQKPEQFILQGYAQSVQGFTVADEPVIKLPSTASTEEIGEAVLSVLQQVRSGVAHPNDWREFEKENLKRLGFKSRKIMHADCKACILSFDGEVVSALPSINRKTGFDHLPAHAVKTADIQPAAIGTVVAQAFEYCQ